MENHRCLMVIALVMVMAVTTTGARAGDTFLSDKTSGDPIMIVQSEMSGGSQEQPQQPPVRRGQSREGDIPLGQTGNERIPGGQTAADSRSGDAGIGADIFGRQGGRVHPFVSFQVLHTDNVFATNQNTENDWVTTIGPGIWVALPANREKLLAIDTDTSSSGGLKLGRIKPEATRRYQLFALYSPELILYGNNSQHDHFNHTAEGLFQYNFNFGLSFDVIDLFHDREEIAGNGRVDELFRHQDNLFDFITTYESDSNKFKVQLNYANYNINYKDAIVEYRDRNDNSVNLTLFYKLTPKTSLLAGTRYADISFDTGTINDSVETGYYGGISWEVTARSRGTFRLGYLEKDFDDDSVKDQDGFSVELQTQHNFTPKRALNAIGYRKFHESDLAGRASSFLSTGIDLALLQRFTEKWSGTLSFLYEENEYNGINRDDKRLSFGPAVRFEPKRWLFFDLGYTYSKNDSNIDFFDYEINQFFFRATASL